MADTGSETRRSWVAALVVAASAALCCWWLFATQPPQPPSPAAGATPQAPVSYNVIANPVAKRYVSAFQSGEWNTVIEITRWMQERLLHVQARDGSPQAREAERMRLRKGLSERTMEGNQLRPEGIEDQYVFVPGATVKAIALDEGQPGLKPPAQSRTWFEVTFAKRSQALRDGAGIPIRSIAVGVNVSADGFVLKGSVIGNLDVDTEWIFYDWNDVL